ncbi:MAG: hypothetical protein ACK4M7_06825 [Burkholderiales bacterium]|jgi:uncharacterized protein YcfL
MKKLLAVLLAGAALVACSNNENSTNATASGTEASAPVVASAPVATHEASETITSTTVEASAAK